MQKSPAEKRITATAAHQKEASQVICYRFKCAESGNGLSHYIMYGDLPQETADE